MNNLFDGYCSSIYKARQVMKTFIHKSLHRLKTLLNKLFINMIWLPKTPKYIADLGEGEEVLVVHEYRVVHLDPLRYWKLHEDWLLSVERASTYTGTETHYSNMTREKIATCFQVPEGEEFLQPDLWICWAKKLVMVQLISQKITKKKSQLVLWNRCKLSIPLWWMKLRWWIR